jgi:hypothetical protein
LLRPEFFAKYSASSAAGLLGWQDSLRAGVRATTTGGSAAASAPERAVASGLSVVERGRGEGDSGYPVGPGEREAQPDGATEGVSADHDLVDAELIEDCQGVLSDVGDGEVPADGQATAMATLT